MSDRKLTPAMAEARSAREDNRAKSRRREAAARETARREQEAIATEQSRLKAECLARMAKRAQTQ